MKMIKQHETGEARMSDKNLNKTSQWSSVLHSECDQTHTLWDNVCSYSFFYFHDEIALLHSGNFTTCSDLFYLIPK